MTATTANQNGFGKLAQNVPGEKFPQIGEIHRTTVTQAGLARPVIQRRVR